MPLHEIDESVPEPHADEQGDDAGDDGAERDVSHQTGSGPMTIRRCQVIK